MNNSEVVMADILRIEQKRPRCFRETGERRYTIIEITNVDREVENALNEKQNEIKKQGSNLRWQSLSFTKGLGGSDGFLCESERSLRKVLEERNL
ncbi:MAG: hypothetical protein Unbinned1322contig1000_19 [Prokaryotic dsDNA virus sp.]|nr:hypothetical protein [Aequorivita sp.]QDP57275.1 MAG: hypothetical protein Unbinned1322contig1000_19 [Prokaryotic dsDNA virus sp.]|tara:strand:+ start:6287 stop:6571 length:285 start_codon:yes stop_codon:yes gene_type:complete